MSNKKNPSVNPYHIKLSKVEKFAGFAVEKVKTGEKVRVLVRAFVHSDQPEFYSYSEQISALFLNKYYQVSGISAYLVLMHQDLSADVYVNVAVPMSLQTWAKRKIKPGEPVRQSDIVDVKDLRFRNIQIKEDDSVIFCFRTGWKFGLYFNFEQIDKRAVLNVDQLYHDLGTYYKHLAFKEVYSILENEKMFDEMLNDGWFPFIQLLGGGFRRLAEFYKDKASLTQNITKFVNGFDKSKITAFVDRWWQNNLFKEKQAILTAGIEAYVTNTDQGFITCIKTLYSEVGGIVEISYVRNKGTSPKSFKDLLGYLEQKAEARFASRDSLGFPGVFLEHLRQVMFKNFDLETGDVDLSRHSVSHGVAKPEAYDKTRALQAILILDQMHFYLQ